jgi:hypothetical protein
MVASLLIATFDPGDVGRALFFRAGFHAHLVLGLAGRSGIIFHACGLLIAAYLATRLSLRGDIGRKQFGKHHKRYRKYSHGRFPCLGFGTVQF